MICILYRKASCLAARWPKALGDTLFFWPIWYNSKRSHILLTSHGLFILFWEVFNRRVPYHSQQMWFYKTHVSEPLLEIYIATFPWVCMWSVERMLYYLESWYFVLHIFTLSFTRCHWFSCRLLQIWWSRLGIGYRRASPKYDSRICSRD